MTARALATLLSEWIEAERQARGHSIIDVAEAVGVSSATIYNHLYSIPTRLNIETRESLARYLRVDVDVIRVLRDIESDGLRYRGEDARMRGRLSELGQRLEETRRQRGHGVAEAVGRMGITFGPYAHLKRVHRPRRIQRHVWEGLAAYAGVSVAEALRMAALPAEPPAALPRETWAGTKRHPTLTAPQGCNQCPFERWCHADVIAGDFAWCEDVIDVDVDLDAGSDARPRVAAAMMA